MYLKRIIASGFKSFADKVTLTLEKRNITGIVGPNGSGKSNIIDAVRWVMGEQNAKMLRGEKATDIIFSGSEKRKPLGMAEVSLVFDNSEPSPFCPVEYRHENEITLTRRLYADGSREYQINKRDCRLKDILSFFASSGLGGRSYSMIQQGQVDRILQAKPEEIREIIEEAAGTLIFKRRQMETQKKLESIKVNLSRVDDILQEIVRQKSSLQEQVEKAQKWQDLSSSLKEKESSFFLNSYDFNQKNYKKIQQAKEASIHQEVETIANLTAQELRYEGLQKKLAEADPELFALNEEIAIIREKIASLEATIKNNQTLLSSGEEQLDAISKELFEDEKNLRVIEEHFLESKNFTEHADDQSLELEGLVEEFSHQQELVEEEVAVVGNKLEELKEDLRQVERLLDTNKMRKQNLDKENEKNVSKRFERNQKLQILEEEYSQASILVDASQVKLSALQKAIDKKLSDKNQLELQANENAKVLEHFGEENDLLKEKFHEIRARLKGLEEYKYEKNDLLAFSGWLEEKGLQKTCAVLPNCISFKTGNLGLTEGVQKAFETWAERLVVFDLEALPQISGAFAEKPVKSVPISYLDGNREHTTEFSSYVKQYSLRALKNSLAITKSYPGLELFLDRLWVIDCEKTQGNYLETIPAGMILFKTDGMLLSPGYDFTLSSSSEEGLLAQKTLHENLSVQFRDLELKLEQGKTNRELLLVRQDEYSKKIIESDRDIMASNKTILGVLAELQMAQNTVIHKEEVMNSSKMEFRSIEDSLEKYEKEVNDILSSSQSLQEEKNETSSSLEELKMHFEELQERRDEVKLQLDQKRIDLASLKAKSQMLKQNFQQNKVQYELIGQKFKRRQEEKETLRSKIVGAKTHQQKCEFEIKECILAREEREGLQLAKREANQGLMEELKITEQSLKRFRELQQTFQKNLSEKEVELERIKSTLFNLQEQATEKYNLDLETTKFQIDPEFNPPNYLRQISLLRNQLENLGAVNMIAIDEYKQLVEREDFINKQKEEITCSCDLLEIAISEIEETSKTKFMATFESLSLEFKGLFPILFPNGEGQIVLVNPERPLDSGVEIMVRLPGKSRQSMSLFSGGEKALTAIALIFALLKSKPTPFCFLDEVDAPLDETNVVRYNTVLETLSGEFQFIVITHRRRTMEVLDTLYGVTMQEGGVSKVVGVDLTKSLPSHLQKAFKEQKQAPAPNVN